MKYIIQESKPLVGTVKISGAKNSALGLIVGALLTNETMIINNVPHVSDVENLLNAIETIGGKITFSNNVVTLNSQNINPNIIIDYEDIRKIRASYYLLGALLGKYKKAVVALPGGCQIGTRPIDLHLKGFRALGATTKLINGNIVVEAKELKGNTIYLDFPSVGATINIMLASVFAKGITIIRNAAREPHIVDIANMLIGMGAIIKGAGTTEIRIMGCEQLHGCEHTTIPDQIEAGTFMLAAAISSGDIVIENIIVDHMDSVSMKLREMGCEVIEDINSIRVVSKNKLKSTFAKTMPYPGFPTDLQPQLAVTLGLANGVSMIQESIFESRFMYVDELARMNGEMQINGNINLIYGKENYDGAIVYAPDLRAGAALVLAGLVAKGTTTIKNIEYIERGYENFVEKLQGLGANIKKVE